MDRTDLDRRLREYADRNGLVLLELLGSGVHGNVFTAKYQTKDGRSAVKVHEQSAGYSRERDTYLRLREHDITTVRGCNVPELIAYDDELWIIEMTVVTRPFVLDFGGAYLDQRPDFADEVMADWRAEKQDQFGSHWPEVQAILRHLESYGIYMIDVNPGNISFDA